MEKTAINIVKKLKEAGYEAYFAGGSVRDLLMEHEANDYDIATSAKPDEIEKLLSKTIPIGKRFGVILAIENEHHFEVATFRSDSSLSDGRRPDAVLFTSAKEDALRRDFTINGLFYDPITKEVFDYIDGQKDIHDKIIRFIGNPNERIKEDHLRLLRAIRFKNKFDFQYDLETKEAVHRHANLIQDVSKERVSDELTKMFLHPTRAHAIRELDKLDVLDFLLPELIACKNVKQPLQYHQEGDVYTHILKALHDMPNEWANIELVWAILLHDIGKPGTYEKKTDRIHFNGHAHLSAEMAKEICKRLKFSKAKITKIAWLIDHHMTINFIPEMRRAHQAALFWHPWFEELMKLHYCDENGSVPSNLQMYEEVMKLYDEFKNEKLLEDHFKPFISGKELIDDFGVPPSSAVADILALLREEQIEGNIKTKDEAKIFTKEIIEDMK